MKDGGETTGGVNPKPGGTPASTSHVLESVKNLVAVVWEDTGPVRVLGEIRSHWYPCLVGDGGSHRNRRREKKR